MVLHQRRKGPFALREQIPGCDSRSLPAIVTCLEDPHATERVVDLSQLRVQWGYLALL